MAALFDIAFSVRENAHINSSSRMKFKDPDELKEWLITKHVDLEDAKAAAGPLFDANFTSSDSLEDAPATDLRPALSVPLSNIVSKKLKTTGGDTFLFCLFAFRRTIRQIDK